MNRPEYEAGTVSQQLIWAGQQLAPESPLYNMAHRFDFSSAVDPERFRSAFAAIVARSDTMRTVFETDDGVLVQRVLAQGPDRFELVDLSRGADPEGTANAWIEDRIRRPFDLRRASFDSALLRLGPERWTWFFNQHHVATDAWSMALLYRALGEAYAQPVDPMAPTGQMLPSFAEHIAFEKRHADTRAFAAAVKHWRDREKNAGRLLRLYGRSETSNHSESHRIHLPLGTDRTQQLRELARADGVRMFSPDLTLFTVLATALIAYLSRVSGEQNVTIGCPAHNRLTATARETIGLFVEVYPLGVILDERETFRTLLNKVAVEGTDLIRHAQPGTSTPASVRLFNVVLNYLHIGFGQFGDLPALAQWVHPGASDPGHALRVHIHDLNETGALEALFDVNTLLFEATVATRIPQHFLRVLDAMLDDLDAVIGTVPMALEDETPTPMAVDDVDRLPCDDETVVSLFDTQAECTPDATALRLGDSEVTYRDLRARSQVMARALVDRGIVAGDCVGVHAKRSIELVVAVLGILRAGAAYVPLEARLPEQRLRFILEDTRTRLVIAEGECAAAVARAGVESMTLAAREQPDAPGLPRPAHDSPAYVIYTSGSTGRPKGVVVDHRGLADYIRWARRTFAGDGPTSFPLHTAFGFDLTVTSLFVPLISGGEIVIYPEPDTGPDLSVLTVFEDDAVDVVKLTPAHLDIVTDQSPPPQRIRVLIVGGEDLKTARARAAVETLGDGIRIFNEYGPTEAIVGCMSHLFDLTADTDSSVPIGTPAEGVPIHVLDDGLNPVPDGVEGEIFVGGDRLARGYWGRDDLTAERFLADPFRPGGRMYRTGDRARFTPRGLLEFRGRLDAQIKIRGARVEIAEVEHALAAHHAVRSCAVEVTAGVRARDESEERLCARCGLSSRYPGTTFDADGVCNICCDFESYKDKADVYYKPMKELHAAIADAAEQRTGPYDCLMLLSGGKDSTYALHQLARITPRILTMTLDNGFISDGAKANIRRAVDALGVDHRFMTTPAMNAIFVDSLKRHSNVCNGCFKTIYTLAVKTALEEGIPAIVTGLSRGQFFETRLTAELFRDEAVDAEAIERTVLEARKAYHHVEDAVTQNLDVSAVQSEDTFDKVTFIDFYRYCDVTLEEIYAFLEEHAPWVRPDDTGRSTNCRLNEVGIYIHNRKEGFHSYALPYSWDVRMGHKKREAAIEELDDQIDARRVADLLEEIGYDDDIFASPDETRLAAYFTADEPLSTSALRAFLADRLIEPMIPNYFIQLDEIPLTINGKVDRRALPDPRSARAPTGPGYRPARSSTERALSELWRRVLRVNQIGIDDNFYDLGGDSISAIQIAARATDQGLEVEVMDLFDHQSVAKLAEYLDSRGGPRRPAPTDAAEKDAAPLDRFVLANLDSAGLETIAELLKKSNPD